MGVKILSKIKRNIIKKLLRFTNNINERLSKKMVEELSKKMDEELLEIMNEIEIATFDVEAEMATVKDEPDWDMVRDHWEQTHGKGALVEQFKNSALMLIEYRILQDYSSHLDKNHGLIQTENRIGDALSSASNMSWIDISAALEKEEEESQLARAASSDKNEWPPTPWWSDVCLAVMALRTDLTIRKLIWEIHEYAERSRRGENRVNSLILEGDWYSLATQILSDLEALDFVFPSSRSDDKNSIKLAIERLRDQYFNGCRILESGVLFCKPKWDFWDAN